MENKFINLERCILILALISLLFYLFDSGNHLRKSIQLIEKSKLQMDSVSLLIAEVKQTLIDLSQLNDQTQKQLQDLNIQRDLLASIYSDKLNTDRLRLKKYEKLIEASMAEHDSLNLIIKKFE